jgi:hypothetical protein
MVTADALQTHPEAAEFLVGEKHVHYLFTVNANQPTLLGRCQRPPWHRVPVLDRTRDRGHSRLELRTLKAVSVYRFGFPLTAQVLQVTRKARALRPAAVYDRDRLRGRQPPVRAGRPRPPRRPHPWALGHRGATPHPRCHLRRGGLPGPHRWRPRTSLRPCATWSSGCWAGGAGQRRRRATPPRPRPTPAPGHPRHRAREQLRMNRPSRQNDETPPGPGRLSKVVRPWGASP